MTLNYLIKKIEDLTIKEEEYNDYKNLLNLPKPLYIQVIKGIVEGKMKAKDFNIKLSNYRKEIYDEIGFSGTSEELVENLLKKFNNEKVSSAYLKKDDTLEQKYIQDRAESDGIIISSEDFNDIFITEKNYENITMNYDLIDITKEDKLFMIENNISEIQMKKMKLLRNFLLLRHTNI